MSKLLNKKGLSLIEIIVTLAILGIVIPPLTAMFITSQRINNESKKEYDSIQLAQKYIEEIKSMNEFNRVALNLDSYSSSRGVFIGETINKGYNLTIKIEPAFVDVASIPKEIMYDNEKFISSDINITIKDGRIEFSDFTFFNFIIKKFKIVLENNVKINVTNYEKDAVSLYIFSKIDVNDSNYNAEVKVLEGIVKVVKNETSSPKPDNILYKIEIVVERGGQEINTIEGTVIFKYKPDFS